MGRWLGRRCWNCRVRALAVFGSLLISVGGAGQTANAAAARPAPPTKLDKALATAKEKGDAAAVCAKALPLLAPFIDRGVGRAEFAAAELKYDGCGGSKQPAAAVPLLEDAVRHGDVKAMDLLSYFYGHGEGVPQDYERSNALLRSAVAAGSGDDALVLSDFYRDGSNGLPKDDTLAAHWYEVALALHSPFASAGYLSDLYAVGRGVPADPVKAAQLMLECAKSGVSSCQIKMGRMYLEGSGVAQNFSNAYMWLNIAAARMKDVDFDLMGLNTLGPLAEVFTRDFVVKQRDYAASKLDPDQLQEAQRLASEWTPTPRATEAAMGSGSAPSQRIGRRPG